MKEKPAHSRFETSEITLLFMLLSTLLFVQLDALFLLPENRFLQDFKCEGVANAILCIIHRALDAAVKA